MTIISAVKLATTQRQLVKKVATYKGGEFKFNSQKFNDIPDAAKKAASEIAQSSGEYSKNLIKNIQSWVKRFSAIRNLEKEIQAGAKKIK